MVRSAATDRGAVVGIGNFTKTATSPDINCHQGITTDGTNFYGFDTTVIYKFDASWNVIATNASAASAASATHLGDGQYYNGNIYVPAENYVNDSTPATNKKIAVFNATTLAFVTSYSVSQMDEIASVCVDATSGIMYAISYVDGRYIYKYAVSNGAYLGRITLTHAMKRAQGITVYGGTLWVARGLYNRLYKIGMDGCVLDVRPIVYVPGPELEGIDYTTGTLYALADYGTDEVVETFQQLPSQREQTAAVTTSISFNNTGYITLSQVQGLPIYRTTGYSICGYIFARAKGSSATVYGEGNSSSDTQYLLFDVLATNNMRIRINNDQNTTLVNVTSDIVIPRNKWVPFVWSDNGGQCFLMVDGKVGAINFNYTPAGTLTFNRSSIGVLGKMTNTSFFMGRMSNIKLFDYALSYQQALTVMRDNTPGTVANYALQEGSGVVANDTSGNGNNGVITNGSWVASLPPFKPRFASTGRIAA